MSSPVRLIEDTAALVAVAARASRGSRVAVDVESNGLFAYRGALCVLQIAWIEDEGEHEPHENKIQVAIVDTLAVPVAPLAPLLGEGGPIKVLHDLSFDAQMLAAAGAPIGRARDTSVAARLLGRKATGLGALLEAELGVRHDKSLQQHDWARRPLGAAEIDYLAGDVRHLLALDDALRRHAEETEIADECAYKLASAGSPRPKARPGWTRIKGVAALDAVGMSAARRLWAARELAAEREDVPPFKVVSNEVLLDLSQRRPASIEALRAVRGAAAGLAGKHVEAWLAAIAGAREEEISAEDRAALSPEPPRREEIARRRARETQVSGWRRAEAKRRGVDPQVVLPGHCADEVVLLLTAHDARGGGDAGPLREEIARIPGLGARRLERYGEALAALGSVSRGQP